MGIEIQNIRKTYGQSVVIDDLSLELTEGHIYGLLGNNGVGKTTLLNLITNRIYAEGGSVRIDGEYVRDNDKVLEKVFMVGEQNLYPDDISVKKAFKVTKLLNENFNIEEAYQLADAFKLNINKKIKALSTGYSSIFRLVLALAMHTPYIILDEPVLGLDAQHRDLFYKELIKKYADEACTFIISTHLIQEVAHLIDHTLIMNDGKIIVNSPTEELLEKSVTISGPIQLVDQFIKGKEVISETILGGLKTVSLNGTLKDTQIPEGLEVGKMNLQDYFISLMNGEAK